VKKNNPQAYSPNEIHPNNIGGIQPDQVSVGNQVIVIPRISLGEPGASQIHCKNLIDDIQKVEHANSLLYKKIYLTVKGAPEETVALSPDLCQNPSSDTLRKLEDRDKGDWNVQNSLQKVLAQGPQ
jgi:hypothetical protein